MLCSRLAFAALLLIPALASAQRGGMGGSKEADWNTVANKGGVGGPTITSKDLEGTTPYKFILDRKKDIKLTEAQITNLKASDAALKESNKQRFVLIDSLKKEARPKTSGTPSAEDEVRLVVSKEALQVTVREVQASYDAAAKLAMPMLDEPQRAEGQKALDKYNEEMTDLLREKLGGRGGGPGAGGRGGRGRGGL